MRYLVVIGFVWATLLPGAARAQDDSEEASKHFKSGVALFNENKKQEAVEEFNAAYAIKPAWKIMYNIGQCNASLRRYGMAIEAFEKYLGQGGDEVPADRQDEVLTELDRLRRMVGSVKVQGSDGVDIYIDDIQRGTTPMASAILVTAGVEHRIRLIKNGEEILAVGETVSGNEVLELTAPEESAAAVPPPVVGPTPEGDGATATEEPVETEIDASASESALPEHTETTADSEPERSGLPKVVFIASAAAAGAFGLAAGGLAIAINSKWESSQEKLNDNPWVVDTDAVSSNIHTLQILGYVSLGLAAAGLITAVTVIPFTDWKSKKSKEAALQAAPWAFGEGGGLVLEGRF